MGSMIDAAGVLRSRLIKREFFPPRMRYLKYALFAAFILGAAAGSRYVFTADPVTVAARFFSLNLFPLAASLADGLTGRLLSLSGYSGAFIALRNAVFGALGGAARQVFAGSFIILIPWAVIIILTLSAKRFWCRSLCPLGGMLASAGAFSPFSRRVEKCSGCGVCASGCRMGAILKDGSTRKTECVLCMDCVYNCRVTEVRFGFGAAIPAYSGVGIDRRDFLRYAALSGFAAAAMAVTGRKGVQDARAVIRPPGAPGEEKFTGLCIRCGNCMRACPTNGLQPVFLESGAAGIWTPHLVPEIGPCAYRCARCGGVCPTGAVPRLSLEKKQRTVIGLAVVDRKKCIPWQGIGPCLICLENCPVPGRAIRGVDTGEEGSGFRGPEIIRESCIGCGACSSACPARPMRAVKVRPL